MIKEHSPLRKKINLKTIHSIKIKTIHLWDKKLHLSNSSVLIQWEKFLHKDNKNSKIKHQIKKLPLNKKEEFKQTKKMILFQLILQVLQFLIRLAIPIQKKKTLFRTKHGDKTLNSKINPKNRRIILIIKRMKVILILKSQKIKIAKFKFSISQP